MAEYLLDHRPASKQFRNPRRATCSGVVVLHSAENVPDLAPPDTGAENVARFIASRSDPGSYHRVSDADTTVALMPWWYEAFHDGTGTNAHSVGISGAFRAAQLPSLPTWWVHATVTNMARAAADYAGWLRAVDGLIIPARRINAAQARARVPGFTTHAELDPANRSDPGAHFPFDLFLHLYAQFSTGQGPSYPPPVTSGEVGRTMELQRLLAVASDGVIGPVTESAMRRNMIGWRRDLAGNRRPDLVSWLQRQGNRKGYPARVDGQVGPEVNHLIVVVLGQPDGICGPLGYRSAIR